MEELLLLQRMWLAGVNVQSIAFEIFYRRNFVKYYTRHKVFLLLDDISVVFSCYLQLYRLYIYRCVGSIPPRRHRRRSSNFNNIISNIRSCSIRCSNSIRCSSSSSSDAGSSSISNSSSLKGKQRRACQDRRGKILVAAAAGGA